MNGLVSINGDCVPVSEAKISVLDRGFLFGDGIFEVIVGFHGKLLALDEHLVRLRESGLRIGMSLPWSHEELKKEVYEVYAKTSFDKSYVRIGITRGEGLGISPPKNTVLNKLIYILPSQESPQRIYEKGISLKTAHKFSTVRGPSIKHPFYLPSIVEMVNHQDYDDVLWVNNGEEITEAATSNIFFIGRDGNNIYVETPNLDSGLLRGVTRHFVIELLMTHKVEIRENAILLEEIARFDEAFLTSTVRGLVPVHNIDSHVFQSVRTSAFYHKINSWFLDWIRKDIGKNLDWNSGKILEI